MADGKTFIKEYLEALSGKPKPLETVQRYTSDKVLIEHILQVEEAFPLYEIVAEDIVSEGEKVVVRGIFRGTHTGSFAGIAPTGITVSAGLMIFYKLDGNRISEHWMELDRASLFSQLQSAAAGIHA